MKYEQRKNKNGEINLLFFSSKAVKYFTQMAQVIKAFTQTLETMIEVRVLRKTSNVPSPNAKTSWILFRSDQTKIENTEAHTSQRK